MRKVLLVLLVALLAKPTGVSAEMVSNVISNSTVYQYIFINCANDDCQALMKEVVWQNNNVAVGQAPAESTATVESAVTAESAVDFNSNIVENNMPIAEQTIINVVDPPVVENGAVNLPVPTEVPVSATEAAATETVVSEQNPVVTSDESTETAAETTNTATVVESFFPPAERKVVISEIMSAPFVGNVEWVEIENRGGGNVDLTGWTLVEGSGKKIALFGTIQPGNYLMFEKSSLNNSGDVVTLKDETGAAVSEVSYGDWNDGNVSDNAPASKTGNSTALFGEIYKETEVPTPNQENIFQLTAIEPTAVLTTSAAATSAVESPVVISAPVQTVTPSVTTQPVVAAPACAGRPTVAVPPTEATVPVSTFQFSDKIKISEFLADPTGVDDGEWIELYNEGDVDVDLFGWSVDDAEGGSKPYKIERHVTIKADDFQVFKKEETLLVLNNSSDEVRLFDPENKLVDKVAYSSVKENHSWAWLNNGWEDSTALTPGMPNQTASAVEKTIALSPVAALIQASSQTEQFQAAALEKKTAATKSSAAVYSLSPAEAVVLPVKTKVTVTGQVVAGQNVFGKNYFYLDGAQVYWNNGETALAIGDVVRVGGAVSESYGEKRINAKSVEIVGHEQGVTADAVAALPLTADKVGKLITIAGQIVEKKPNKWLLADASGEQVVYLKQGADIDTGVYTVGDELTITGVLSRYNDELRLMPRGKEDIVNLTWQKKEALGAPALENATVPVGQAKNKVTLALLFAFVGLFFVNGYWCWRHREEILKGVKPFFIRLGKSTPR